MNREQNSMPDVPNPDFVGAVCEIWFTVNYAAYHLAYTRVYLQTRSMQTPVEELRLDDLALVRQASSPELLRDFGRWQDVAWRRDTLALH